MTPVGSSYKVLRIQKRSYNLVPYKNNTRGSGHLRTQWHPSAQSCHPQPLSPVALAGGKSSRERIRKPASQPSPAMTRTFFHRSPYFCKLQFSYGTPSLLLPLYLLCAEVCPGPTLPSCFLMTTQRGRHFYSHFIDEGTETLGA